MARHLVLLIDYKSHFGSKYVAEPYRSGMSLSRLAELFRDSGYELELLGFPDVELGRDWKDIPVVYTSSEDHDGHYKSYIEDVVLGLELAGARTIPDFRFLRAHENKVFMEILRELLLTQTAASPARRLELPCDPAGRGPAGEGLTGQSLAAPSSAARHFGTYEEWEARQGAGHHANAHPSGVAPRTGTTPDTGQTVVKSASGALSRGVELGTNIDDLRAKVKKLSRSPSLRPDLRDLVRALRRTGYEKESRNRRKFVTQEFVSGLDHDWKVLVYGDRYFVLRRGARPDDFRASGGGRLSFHRELPPGLLDFARQVFDALRIPNVSLDIGVTPDGFVLFEFQAVYFGTYTVDHSEFHFRRVGADWSLVEGPAELEAVYAESVVRFLEAATR